MARAFIAVGSNIEPEQNIRQALRLLAQSAHLAAVSTFYREPALGRPEQSPFYNGVVAAETPLPPAELKWSVLRRIEADLGRHRGADRYAARTIDLDLLIYEDCVTTTRDLVLPDPLIAERAFLAVPLAELAPELILPGSVLTIAEVVKRLANTDMQPLPEFTRGLRRDMEARESV